MADMGGLLDALPECEREELMAAPSRRHATGAYLWQAGDVADCLHLVTSGCLAITVPLPSGQVGLIDVAGPGDHCGEIALILAKSQRITSVTALRSTITCAIPATAFDRLWENNRVQQVLSRQLATQVAELHRCLAEQMYSSLEVRLLSRLSRLAGMFDGEVPLTQDQLAQLTGSTRQSINHKLSRLVDRGIIDVSRGRIQILDPTALHRRLTGLRDGQADHPQLRPGRAGRARRRPTGK